MNEHDGEPVRGLPARLPEGEHILWQGAPDWRTLARTALHVRWVAGYFGVLALWDALDGTAQGETVGAVVSQAALTVVGGSAAVGLLALYAWLSARTTVYTLTNKRFVVRHGVALSKIFNIPYRIIAEAGLKADARGVGDIALRLTAESKVAYPHLWPHVRPWRFSHPEPMLRAVPDAATVARTLGEAVERSAREAGRPFAAGRPADRPEAIGAPAPVAA
jgi:hypothetical protein